MARGRQVARAEGEEEKVVAFSSSTAARLLALASLRVAYDPNQPRDEDGRWTTVYHGTSTTSAKGILEAGFRSRTGANGALLGEGVYFTSKRHQAESYGETVIESDLTGLRVKDFPTERAYKRYLKSRVENWEPATMSKAMADAGYDAVRINKDVVVVFDPTKTKPKLRGAAANTHPVRHAADQGERKILLAVRTAAAVASRVSPAKMADAFAASLRRTLPGALARVALAGAEASEELKAAAFNPDQPRDEDGRWTDSAGGKISVSKVSRAIGGNRVMFSTDEGILVVDTDTFADYLNVNTVEVEVQRKGLASNLYKRAMDYATEIGRKGLASQARNRTTDGDALWDSLDKVGEVTKDLTLDDLQVWTLRPRMRTLKSRDPLSAAASAWAKKHTAELVTGIAEVTRKRIATVVAKQLPDKQTHTALVKILKDPKRAQLIARTEAMIAAHEGQRILWRRAVEDGLLDADFKRRWIFTDDEVGCPQCEALDGQLAEAEGEYEGGISSPPAHPQCRCTEGLVPASVRTQARAAYDPSQPRDEDGKWTTVYHGTNENAWQNIKEQGLLPVKETSSGASSGDRVYLVSTRERAEYYAKQRAIGLGNGRPIVIEVSIPVSLITKRAEQNSNEYDIYEAASVPRKYLRELQ